MSSRSNHQRLVALEKQMEEAAADFDFEKAVALRDEIVRLRAVYGGATTVVDGRGGAVKGGGRIRREHDDGTVSQGL